MADQIKFAAPDANGVRWADGTSKKGVSFRYGYKDTGSSTARNPVIKASDDGWYSVNWTVGSSGTTSDEIHNNTHITGYDLIKLAHNDLYDYQLTFYVDGGWERNFKDDDNDEYSCTTVTNGAHSIQYNSDKPTIVKVN